MSRYYILVFDTGLRAWTRFRKNGKIVYFNTEDEAENFGDNYPRYGDIGNTFRYGDWQVLKECN